MIKKALGGTRLGSGAKMDVEMHGYGRSTHDMSTVRRTTMAPGTLVPIYTTICQEGDTWDIDLAAIIKTQPTINTFFGAYRLQLDAFYAPMRLFNRQLHNNKLDVGMDMKKVKFPQMKLFGANPDPALPNPNSNQISQDSLLAYLGIRGLGKAATGNIVTREFNAMPVIMYWDIFKNYYANVQEKTGYVISGVKDSDGAPQWGLITRTWTSEPIQWDAETGEALIGGRAQAAEGIMQITGDNLTEENILIGVSYYNNVSETIEWKSLKEWEGNPNSPINAHFVNDPMSVDVVFKEQGEWAISDRYVFLTGKTPTISELWKPELIEFELKNIDDMRERILSFQNEVAMPLTTGVDDPYPYRLYRGGGQPHEPRALTAPLHGLAIKTFQSDRFNNFVNEETVDGVNGIAAISSVDTSSGSFSIDTLNLAEKVYNMLNRVAAAGGTYRNWREASYGRRVPWDSVETPVYMGGTHETIFFDDVEATASTEGQELGSLAGRADTRKQAKTIRIKAEENGYIMVIASITPLIDYYQGNKWFGNLKTMADLHQPELDEIGYQDLPTDEMAAWDTVINNGVPEFKSMGKQPAWIHYMTDTNEVFGDFAEPNNMGFMVQARNYEWDENLNIKDLTTYVDPSKYNNPFATKELGQKNFWCHFGIHAKARRIMSAKLIPNM